MFGLDTASTLIIGGLGLGIAFGALAERSEFCLLSGVRQSLRGETADKLGAFSGRHACGSGWDTGPCGC